MITVLVIILTTTTTTIIIQHLATHTGGLPQTILQELIVMVRQAPAPPEIIPTEAIIILLLIMEGETIMAIMAIPEKLPEDETPEVETPATEIMATAGIPEIMAMPIIMVIIVPIAIPVTMVTVPTTATTETIVTVPTTATTETIVTVATMVMVVIVPEPVHTALEAVSGPASTTGTGTVAEIMEPAPQFQGIPGRVVSTIM
jgi:hypothetical protein